MPKRPNPFGDPFAMQLKTHVSQKEVDLGVNKEKNMKAVYEKTLAILFQAQQRMGPTNGQATNGHGAMNSHTANGHDMNGHVVIGGDNHINGHGALNSSNGHMVNGIAPQSNGQSNNGLQQVNGHSHQSTSSGGMMDVDVMATDETELVPGQSFLDSNCRVIHSPPNSVVHIKNHLGPAACHNNNNTIPSLPLCQMCNRKSRPVKSHCTFCEKSLCAECSRMCDNCEDRFCVLCSAVNYDERFERVFCLSCVS